MKTLRLLPVLFLSLAVSCATETEPEKEAPKADANGVVIKSGGEGIFSISGVNPVSVEQFESLVVGSAWREKSRWHYFNGELDPLNPGDFFEKKGDDSDFRNRLYIARDSLVRYYVADLIFEPGTLECTKLYVRKHYDYRYDDKLRVIHYCAGRWEEIGIIIEADENSFTIAHSYHYDAETITPLYDDFGLSVFEKVDSSEHQKWIEMTVEAEEGRCKDAFH